MPKTTSKLFLMIYPLFYQSKTFEEAKKVLEKDVKTIFDYYVSWRLKPNSTKTVVSAFHLNNREAKRAALIKVNNELLAFDECPRYLGIHLDRSLTYKQHLNKTALKIRTRNNILSKFSGSRWGALEQFVLHPSCGVVTCLE